MRQRRMQMPCAVVALCTILGVFFLVSNTPRWGSGPAETTREAQSQRWGGVVLCPLLLATCWVMVRLATASTAPHLDARCAPCIPARDKGHSVRVVAQATPPCSLGAAMRML